MKSARLPFSRPHLLAAVLVVLLPAGPALAQTCADLETAFGGGLHAALEGALMTAAPDAAQNGGLNTHMWGTIVDRDGVVCAVAKTGGPGDQWPGSRVISAQKANTANAFSLPGLALSTANLYSAVQPGGSLFGLQESNPVDTNVAYVGSGASWGTAGDDLVGQKIGGVNVFGGGLALYASSGTLMGALGVSGDTSCADHIIAWRTRNEIDLDSVPAGVSPTGDDNIIFDIVDTQGNPNNNKSGLGHQQSAGGFGHPECGFGETSPGENLPVNYPIE